MAMTTELPVSIAGRIERLCAEGEAFVAEARYDAATLRFTTAFRMLPRPQERWRITPRLFASMVDSCFEKGDLESARQAVLAALECPDALDNPALRMKLGVIYFEAGEFEAAREEFASALAKGGKGVFEDEDPKYWDFVSRWHDVN
jgi:tetratricopeptide (TPR) repeat protein